MTENLYFLSLPLFSCDLVDECNDYTLKYSNRLVIDDLQKY